MVRRRASLHGPPFCKRKNTIIRETGKENGGISYAYGVIIVLYLRVRLVLYLIAQIPFYGLLLPAH